MPVNPWLIAISVMLATFMEVLDTSVATGNFVKVVQRVPVMIVFDEMPPPQYQIGPGMSVVPTIRVRQTPSRQGAEKLAG